MYQLRALGSLDLRGTDGHPVQSLLSHPKRSAVLCYLAIATPHGFQRRDRIAALFWPEHDAEHARHSLRQALHSVRTSLGEDALETRGDEEVALNAARVWCDAAELDRAFDEQRWSDVVELHRGDLLDGFFVPDANGFEYWLEEQRERLRGRARQAAWHCADACAQQGDAGGALAWGRRALEFSPTDEEPLRRFMRLAASLGDRAAARQAYDRFAARLHRELELEPSPETAALVAQLAPASPKTAATGPPAPVKADLAPVVSDGAAPAPAKRRRRLSLRAASAAGAVLLLTVAFIWTTTGRAPAPATSPGPVALAVLPFELEGDERDAYVGSGLQSAVIAALGMIPRLQVITSRPSASAGENPLGPPTYGVTGPPLRQVAGELGATHLLITRVHVAAKRMVVSLRLVDPWTDRILLEHTYEGTTADLFTLDQAITRDVTDALHVPVPQPVATRIGREKTTNVRALELYHQGLFFFNEWNEAGYDSAIVYLEAAVAADSSFALARALLADAYIEKSEVFEPGGAALRRKAYVSAHLATRLDPELPQARIALGNLLWTPEYKWAHDAALEQFALAAAIQPGLSTAHDRLAHIYGHICLLDDALAEVRKALLLDPANNGARWREGYLLTMQQSYPEAVAALRALPKQVAPHLALPLLVEGLTYLGDLAQARLVAEQVVQNAPGDPWARSTLALVLAVQGDTTGALATLAATEPLLLDYTHRHHPEYNMALVNALLGRSTEAIDLLAHAARDGFPCYPRFASDPLLAPLRTDPRFAALLRDLFPKWNAFRVKYSAFPAETRP